MKKSKKIFLIVSITLIITFIVSFTYARYTGNSIWNYFLNSKGFYLSSDNLGESEVNNVNNLWDGGRVAFNLKNNLNNSVISKFDINYNVKCTIENNENALCTINGLTSDENEVLEKIEVCKNNDIVVPDITEEDCLDADYNWISEIATDDLYFEVESTTGDNINDVVVKIEVNSTSPYKKKLTGKFELHKAEINREVKMEYKTYSDSDKLIIINNSEEEKCFNLSWNSSKMHIDANNITINSTDQNNNVNSIKLKIGISTSISYDFYNYDNQTHSTSDFTLEVANDCE